MNKNRIGVHDFMKNYRRRTPETLLNEHSAIGKGELLRYDKELMKLLQTSTANNCVKYVDEYLDEQEHIGNPVSDISIDRETISEMTDRITDRLRRDYDYVDEIVLNRESNTDNGNNMYDILNSFIRTLLLTELFLNRRTNYDINYGNLASVNTSEETNNQNTDQGF